MPTEGSLLAFAKRELFLDTRLQGDGPTQRESYKSHRRQKGDEIPELESLECPEAVRYLWDYFVSMNRRRTSNGFGPNAITDEGVEAWARRKGIRLERFEHEALDQLEAVYLSMQGKRGK